MEEQAMEEEAMEEEAMEEATEEVMLGAERRFPPSVEEIQRWREARSTRTVAELLAETFCQTLALVFQRPTCPLLLLLTC